MKILANLSLVALLGLYSSAADAYCERYTAQIKSIEARMRQPYTVQTGEYLRKRLTELKDKRIHCERSLAQAKRPSATINYQKQQAKARQRQAQVNVPNSNWEFTSPSKDRIKHWEALQRAEKAKLEALKKKVQIKDDQ